MPSSYTSLLRLTLPADGELVGTWGQTVNNGITSLEEAAIAGTATVPMGDANQTLTVANGAADQARNAVINATGALTAQRDIVVPSSSKTYIVRNNTTGGFGVNVKTDAGTGVVVPAGTAVMVYCDGVNVMPAVNASGGALAIPLGTALLPGLSFVGDPNTGLYSPGADQVALTTTGIERMRIDSIGRVGIGKTNPIRQLDVLSGVGTSPLAAVGPQGYLLIDNAGSGESISQANVNHIWQGPGLVERMRIDATGNLMVGANTNPSSARLRVVGPLFSDGFPAVEFLGGVGADPIHFYATNSGVAANAALSAMSIMRNATTSRSINAGGTINASGADYAEYENSGGLTIPKGAVVGFKADGVLTLTFAEAVRFGIKSTNPSYVGGDAWGTEEALGVKKPIEPMLQMPAYDGPPQPTEPVAPVEPAEGASDEELAAFAAAQAQYVERLSLYYTEKAAWDEAQEAHRGACYDAEQAHAAAHAQYEQDKAAFEAALEDARKGVDRIAYSGKVPVNVLGAAPGDYIVAVDAAGAIGGMAVTTPTFDQYRMAVGRVNKILADGRAEVAVIVH